mmetsp:Transcript_20589/g.30175  ORF Transcript_20589/g.30175 Transcript_20589/m.30175 type:complete len:91 (+) Transcript_20589:1409-1681(+)
MITLLSIQQSSLNKHHACHLACHKNYSNLFPPPILVKLPTPMNARTTPAPIMSDLLIHADVASALADLYTASSSASMLFPTKTPPTKHVA